MCVWLDDERIKCQLTQKSCENIEKENICKTSGVIVSEGERLSCIWMNENGKCLKIEDECDKLNTETICLTRGAAMNGEEELECFWLLGNTPTTIQTTSKCILKV
jgi:hypothetical protein